MITMELGMMLTPLKKMVYFSCFWLFYYTCCEVNECVIGCLYLFNVEFPFEFRALEVALEAICSFLDARTRELETDTYPALDELTSKVNTPDETKR